MLRFLPVLLFTAFSFNHAGWGFDFQKAKDSAQQQHKNILVNFSGSDWCGPCIRMHKEIFSDESFLALADSSLLLVRADFPRQKKNKLTDKQKKLNEKLADQYNPTGIFPYTLLLSADGKVLKKWEGYPSGGGKGFIKEIYTAIHDRR